MRINTTTNNQQHAYHMWHGEHGTFMEPHLEEDQK
jgi:hypothetical protein